MTGQGTDADFERLEPVFWRVLAALARHGYAVQPSDARDLIHDFYLEAWGGLRSRFDPALGSFTSYLGGAFYRFARRRIVRSETIANRTVDFETAVADLSMTGTPPDILERGEDLASIKTALSHLGPKERQVLEDLLANGALSERRLAARHALTRYALRELLADCMCKMANALGHGASCVNPDQRIAELLWSQGESPRGAANILGIPVAQVRVARNNLVHILLASMRLSTRSKQVEKFNMTPSDCLDLLRSAMMSLGEEEKLALIRRHSGDIRRALDNSDLDLEESAWLRVQDHPEWIAAIYEAIAELSSEGTDSSELTRTIERIRRNEQRDIGEAFEFLVSTLPYYLRLYQSENTYFSNIETVDEEYQRELRELPSVQAAGATALNFVRYGLTPESIYGATRGLALLFNRTRRDINNQMEAENRNSLPAAGITLSTPIYLQIDGVRTPVSVPDSLILAEVAATPGLPSGTEVPLTKWLIDALKHRPFLVEGYGAYFDSEKMMVRGHDQAHETEWRSDLISRWSRAPHWEARPKGFR